MKDNPKGVPKSKWSAYLTKFLWIGFSALVYYFSDFHQVYSKINLYSISGFISITSALLFASICLYLTVYVPRFTSRKIDLQEWERDCKQEIQSATLAGVICYSSLVIVIWPVYHLLGVFILFVFMLGGLSLISLFWINQAKRLECCVHSSIYFFQ